MSVFIYHTFQNLLVVEETDFARFGYVKSVTTKRLFQFITEIVHRSPDVVSVVCGKQGKRGTLLIFKNDTTCDCIQFYINQFTPYRGQLTQKTPEQYLRDLFKQQVQVRRVDFKFNNEIISIR